MVEAELKEHQRWQLNKMKINPLSNLLQKKVKMDRRDSTRMNYGPYLVSLKIVYLPSDSRLVKEITTNHGVSTTE